MEPHKLVDRLALVSTAAKVRHTVRHRFIMSVFSRLLTSRGKERQPRYAFERQLHASGSYDGTTTLASIHAPTKVFHGRNDKTAHYDLAQAIHEAIPDATMQDVRLSAKEDEPTCPSRRQPGSAGWRRSPIGV